MSVAAELREARNRRLGEGLARLSGRGIKPDLPVRGRASQASPNSPASNHSRAMSAR